MNDKFDELAKAMAQSVTRRSALKKFGVAVLGAVLAALGLGKAEAAKPLYSKNWCCVYGSVQDPQYRQRVCVPTGQGCPPAKPGFFWMSGYPVQSCGQCK